MAGMFLKQYFRQGLFPTPVLSFVVENYGARYGESLAQNRILRHRTKELWPMLDSNSKRLALEIGNRFALDLALGDHTTPLESLRAIAGSWHLTVADQHRLLERNLSDMETVILLSTMSPTDYVSSMWEKRSGNDPLSRFGLRAKISPDTSVPRNDVEWPPPIKETISGQATLVELSNLIAGLHQYNQIVEAYLGEGLTESSVSAWRSFFVLAEDDPDVDLYTVLSAAELLARTSTA
jgi:hypothetical protein